MNHLRKLAADRARVRAMRMRPVARSEHCSSHRARTLTNPVRSACCRLAARSSVKAGARLSSANVVGAPTHAPLVANRYTGPLSEVAYTRAHASSHFVISRGGEIVQLVHLSDIAWHAGHWRTNVESVGIEHEGFTYGPHGFTAAQYKRSAQLAAWLARRSLMPIDRKHIIGHANVPARMKR